jgi:hypothetical protein
MWKKLEGHNKHPHIAQGSFRAKETCLSCIGPKGRVQCEFQGKQLWLDTGKNILTFAAI